MEDAVLAGDGGHEPVADDELLVADVAILAQLAHRRVPGLAGTDFQPFLVDAIRPQYK